MKVRFIQDNQGWFKTEFQDYFQWLYAVGSGSYCESKAREYFDKVRAGDIKPSVKDYEMPHKILAEANV